MGSKYQSDFPEGGQVMQCISCAECVQTCPVPETLYFSTPTIKQKLKRISSGLVIIGTLGIFILLLGITTCLDKKFCLVS